MEAMFCSYSTYILVIVIILLIYSYCTYKLNYWKRRGVLQLQSTSKIFGDFKNGLLLRTGPGDHLSNLYREAPPDSPYLGFYIFHKPCLLLRDPQIIKQIMVSDFANFSNRHFGGTQQKESIGMVNLFGLKDPAWSYLRKKISPTLARGKHAQMLPLITETTKPMMDYLDKMTREKRERIDVQDISFKYTSDLFANLALGTKTDSFNYPDSYYSKFLMDFFCSIRRKVALVAVFFTPELVTLFGSLILFDTSYVGKMFWKAMESREKSMKTRGDYIDSVIQLKNGKQDPLYKFEGDNLVYQTGTFMTGLESSSLTTTFTLLELAKNKECQDLARRDIKEAIAKHGWSVKAFENMTYLGQCISEGLRMHPVVATIDRCALNDYQIPNMDVVIEKGTPIFISLHGLHNDTKYFEDPEMFKPERFGNDRIVSDAFLPYGVGPRMCIAVPLGLLHVKVVLSMILSEYEVCHDNFIFKQDNKSTFTTSASEINLIFTKLIS